MEKKRKDVSSTAFPFKRQIEKPQKSLMASYHKQLKKIHLVDSEEVQFGALIVSTIKDGMVKNTQLSSDRECEQILGYHNTWFLSFSYKSEYI